MKIVFIDTETTGLLKKGITPPGIVEIAALKIEVDQIDYTRINEVGRFHTRINPEMEIDDGAAKVHGITQEDVKHCPTFFEIFQDLADFVLGSEYFGGYNTEFDKQVIEGQLYRYGFERKFPWPPADLDVMKLAKERMQVQGKQGMKFPKLIEAHQHFLGVPLEGAHGALSDIMGTFLVWQSIRSVPA